MAKNAAGKAPAFQFYPMDWVRDLEEHPLEIEGAWIRIVCKLWWSEPKGELSLSLGQWSRILRTNQSKTRTILHYLKEHNIGDIHIPETEPNANLTRETALGKRYNLTQPNGKITVVSRRMVRERKLSDSNRLRQQRFYERHRSNSNLTRPSSSSSSYTYSPNGPNRCKRCGRDVPIVTVSEDSCGVEYGLCADCTKPKDKPVAGAS